jgi:hypothetical protein
MGWFFAGVFLLVALGNPGIAVRWYARGKHGSFLPLVGGLARVAACFTLPFPAMTGRWWIPLVADLGTAYLLSATVVFFIQRACRGAHPPDSGA